MDHAEEPSDEGKICILCVDDEENVLKSLQRCFRKEPYQVLTATSGREGLEILERTDGIGLILSDQRMPEMSGTQFLQQAAQFRPDTPRMILTGYADMNAAIEAINLGGAQRFLVKPWNDQELLLAVRDGLERYRLIQENQRLRKELEEWNTNLKQRVLQQTATIRRQLEETRRQNVQDRTSNDAVILLLADLLDQRHRRLSSHSRTVSQLAASITDFLGLPSDESKEIRHAAVLHDIGLIGVSDRILVKQKDLYTADELGEYRRHPVRGQETVDTIEELREIGRFIRCHHEHFDGSGFPDGLTGERIPLGAQIITLASFIENTHSQLSGPDATFQVSRRAAAAMGTLFNPNLAGAANHAITEVFISSPHRSVAEQIIPLSDVKAGMMLTRDIHSPSGVLIIERQTTLSAEDIRTLERYDLPDSAVTFVRK